MTRHSRTKGGAREKAKGSITTPEISEDISARIAKAINNTKYGARTITGIAKEARIKPNMVISVIKSSPSLIGDVKVYPRRTMTGKLLITTKQRFASEASMKDKFVDVFSTHRLDFDDEQL
jgi:hypothetical protein